MNEADPFPVYDIIIVGAGAAGLAAARTLIAKSINRVLLLEARHAPGGRICAEEWEGHMIERGAEFIHGENTVIHSICKKLAMRPPIEVPRYPHLHWPAAPGKVATHRDSLPLFQRLSINKIFSVDDKLSKCEFNLDMSLASFLSRVVGCSKTEVYLSTTVFFFSIKFF
jgi:hypothetical protein